MPLTTTACARPARTERLRRGFPLGGAAALLLAAACGDGGAGPDLPVVSSVQAVAGNAQSGGPGETLPDSVVVLVTDAKGRALPGVSVSWTIVSGGGSVPAASLTNTAGRAAARWTLGTTAGNAALRAAAGDLSATFSAIIQPGPVSAVAVNPASFTLDPGGQQQLQVLARDAFDNLVAGVAPAWESTEPLIATVDNRGLVRGVAGGTATIRVTLNAREASALVTVTGPAAQIPSISAITPAVLTPGSTATITGSNFASSPAANTVSINGANATVTAASATQLQVTVPAADRLACTPLAPVDVIVSVGSARAVRPHPLRTATPRTLGVAEVAFGTATAPLGCTELAAGSGRYVVAVYNVGAPFSFSGQSTVSNGPGIELRTAIGSAGSGAVAPSALPAVVPAAGGGGNLSSGLAARLRRHLRAHEQVMAENRRLLERVRLPRPDPFAGRAALVSAVPSAGDSLWIRVPADPRQSSVACSQFDSVRARVVTVGTRAIVLEDIAAPLAGQVDTLYQRMGQHFDEVQYPIIRDNFGDPLVLDPQLNNDGRLYMLFTPKVNNLFSNAVLGFVWSGDFDDGTSCRQSNRAEIFYGIVPTVMSGGSGSEWNATDWYDYSRATVVHEVKHVASMAARQHNHDFRFAADSMWLEEAGAMVAEELWARRIFGYEQRGNTGFDRSILCELNLEGSGCTGMPLVMLNHFAFLYDYYEQSASLSFLGRTAQEDATFYGSAWGFLRWLTDHSGLPESQFLTRITQASTAGLTTIQQLTGKNYEELFGEYVLAMALDDRPGFTSTNPRLAQPSWNTRDVFSGMSRLRTISGQIPFPLAFPMVPLALVQPGTTLPQVRPGGVAMFEFAVPTTGAQALEVRSGEGGPLPADLRVVIVRVQ